MKSNKNSRKVKKVVKEHNVKDEKGNVSTENKEFDYGGMKIRDLKKNLGCG